MKATAFKIYASYTLQYLRLQKWIVQKSCSATLEAVMCALYIIQCRYRSLMFYCNPVTSRVMTSLVFYCNLTSLKL